MMNRVLACGLAFALLSNPILAAPADGSGPPAPASSSGGTLDTIVVTGSYIRRTNIESPSPVTTIDAEEIAKSGLPSIADVIRTVSADNSGTLSQAFSGAMAGGADGVALRGLSVDATLVLVDGHRMAAYPLADDGQRQFVDIDSLPMAIVQRVEVLRDGASATYGSDAIAGVVNVILKKEFVGAEVSAGAGSSDRGDGLSQRFSATWGTGSLDGDGHNFYMSLEGRHQQAIPQLARGSYVSASDLTPWGGPNLYGGVINGSLPNPLTTYMVPGQVLPVKGGTVLDPSQTPYQLPGCSAQDTALAADGGGGCAWDTNAYKKIQPRTAGLDFSTHWSQKLGGDWLNTLATSYYLSQAEQYRQPNSYNVGISLVPFAWAGALGGSINQFDPTTTQVMLPANSLDNPFNPASPYFAQARKFYSTVPGANFNSYIGSQALFLRRAHRPAATAHDLRHRRLPHRRRSVEHARRLGRRRQRGLRARRHTHHVPGIPVRAGVLLGAANGYRVGQNAYLNSPPRTMRWCPRLTTPRPRMSAFIIGQRDAQAVRPAGRRGLDRPRRRCAHGAREQSGRALGAAGRHPDGRQLLRARRADGRRRRSPRLSAPILIQLGDRRRRAGRSLQHLGGHRVHAQAGRQMDRHSAVRAARHLRQGLPGARHRGEPATRAPPRASRPRRWTRSAVR